MTCPKCQHDAAQVEVGRWLCVRCWLSWFAHPSATAWAFVGTRQERRLWEVMRRERQRDLHRARA